MQDQNINYISNDKLAYFAEELGRTAKGRNRQSVKPHIRCFAGILKEIRTFRDEQEQQGDPKNKAGEWLLDNYYIARREGLFAIRELRAAKTLRTGADGVPVIVSLSRSLVSSGNGQVTERRCELFLSGLQLNYPLTQAELAAFPAALRIALIEDLHKMCLNISDSESAVGMERIFTSLRLLSGIDLSKMLERANKTDSILRSDPSGIYPLMDEKTRSEYRFRVSKIAKNTRTSEHRVARRAIKAAESAQDSQRHVGFHLFKEAPNGKRNSARGYLYILGNAVLPLALSVYIGFLTESIYGALLALVPASELIKILLDSIFLRFTDPSRIPRMELKDGIPDDGKTLCAVVSLLADDNSGKALARRMEEYRLANRNAGKNLLFGLLLDLPESCNQRIHQCDRRLESAIGAVETLNKKYGGGFFLFTRDRVFSERDKVYMGWERKRGAITELMHLLRGKKNGIKVLAGDSSELDQTQFLLTLDSDTRLGPDTAKKLAGAMLHPLVKPVTDPNSRTVISGHGLIQPRMTTELSTFAASEFSRAYSGQGGTDPYGASSGEIYMDCFGRGGFAGKGIIDVDTFIYCMDGRIQDNSVLSHDTLEGAYLRGGYMGDVELTDSFPSGVLSYFRRLERWTRGDWQNLPWLFKSELHDADRWRIFDSLRRSLVAPSIFAAFLTFFLTLSDTVAYAAVLSAVTLFLPALISLIRVSMRKNGSVCIKYHSSIVCGTEGCIFRAVTKALFLPYEAWICLSAAARALYRMLVSRKKLLAWQTAAQSDFHKNSALGMYMSMWPCVASALILLFFSRAIPGFAVAALWLLSPLFARSMSRAKDSSSEPSDENKEYLLSCAREMWDYYESFCTAENHYLPPDNFQESPPVGLAGRTSPTNIGMCLLSSLSAVKLGIAEETTATELISNILTTLEGMKKWRGHILNWYSTADLSPLYPEYVSTVDSGNLAACLIVLREGLFELGNKALAERASALYEAMNFTALYDKNRNLFCIGIDTETGKSGDSRYDLMSSEARLTAYIAIAKGEIPRRHWRHLSRALVEKDGYRGMVSWTGTMFEYLMPELILPLYRDSLFYETAHFCLHAQKSRTFSTGKPWGISESAFFSLDPSLDYRYKAHGCASLALKRGQDSDLVVSPYSSFLALSIAPDDAIGNLKLLEKHNMRGRFGFWEAIDFTPGRCADENGAVVRCVMAHHVGMSICATANYLCGGYLRSLFMNVPSMAAFSVLLQERVPVGSLLLDSRESDVPAKPLSARTVHWSVSGTGLDFLNPKTALLSNGTYRMIATESGAVITRDGELLPYRNPRRLPDDGAGIDFHLISGGEDIPLLPIGEANNALESKWMLSSRKMSVSVSRSGITSKVETIVSSFASGELRRVTIFSAKSEETDCRIEMSFEPVIAREGDYINHPAFYRLGLVKTHKENVLSIRRLSRGSMPERWMCVCCDRDMTVSESPSGIVTLSVQTSVYEGSDSSVCFSIALGNTVHEAKSASMRILESGEDGAADLASACAALLEMGSSEIDKTMSGIASLVFPHVGINKSVPASAEGRNGLWRYGISGDLPIVSAYMHNTDNIAMADNLLRRHTLLSACGLGYDLVFITADGGNYQRPCVSALWDSIHTLDRDNTVGGKGGIHFVDAASDISALLQSSALIFDLSVPEEDHPRDTASEFVPRISRPNERGGTPPYRYLEDGSFEFITSKALPKRAWSNMLTNGKLGYIATDCGTGHMWYINSREQRISPWLNDPYATVGAETLEIIISGTRRSLFADPLDENCKVTFSFGSACWEKTVGDIRVKTTAFVPLSADARVFIVELPDTENAQIAWQTGLVLSGDDSDAVQIVTSYSDGVLRAKNPRGAFPDAGISAHSNITPLSYTCDRSAWVRGEPNGETGTGYDPCMAGVYPAQNTLVLVCGTGDEKSLEKLTDPETARKALRETEIHWENTCTRITVKTPDETLNRYLNGWSVYQTISCRIMGRSSIYQSGGAYGYRDQLQDTVNLIAVSPDPARQQIISSCAHQFEEGDVQHWWHPADGPEKGVRTRCSDDLLWLPWAVCEYIESTGDKSILADTAQYLSSPPLSESENDRYESPDVSPHSGTVLDHCCRALDMVISRGTGAHNLLLIGAGDWNDGMDKIGEGGKGESVWLSWFFAHTARRFAKITGEARYLEVAAKVGKSADRAWDGGWYLRGYFDDGAPLGSIETKGGCVIDSIAQSFSALCNETTPEKKRIALKNAIIYLFDRSKKIVKLFDPPFSDAPRNPGYIQSYGMGYRENGGQYTHGAIWLAMACLKEGMVQDGYEILSSLLPENHDLAVYQAEPYVIAADVYTAEGREGEAGWSWYTGSAGWFFRVATENLLGLKQRGGRLFIEPCLPPDWDGYEATWHGMQIKVMGGEITVDGRAYNHSCGVRCPQKSQ